jgi:hypothetical protein
MMIKKFYGASLAWLLISVLLCHASSARAQGGSRDHLTPEEVELVRSAQVLDVRTFVFTKAANRRLMALTDPTGVASAQQVDKDMKKWGELPKGTRTQLLTDLAKILEEAINNIDEAHRRDPKNSLLPKALTMLAEASTRFLSQLKPMRSQATGAEREALEQAIENAQLIVEAADRLPADTKTKD